MSNPYDTAKVHVPEISLTCPAPAIPMTTPSPEQVADSIVNCVVGPLPAMPELRKAIASALAERDRHILVLANAALCGRKLIKDLLDDKAGDPAVAVACKQAFAELDAAGSLEYARSLPNA